MGILPRAGAQIKNQEPELSLKFSTAAGTMAIWASGPFLDTNGFAKLTEN